MTTEATIMNWLPWYVMLIASIVDIVRHSWRLSQGVNKWRSWWSIVSLLFLCATWSMLIVSAGSDPIMRRAELAIYIRTCALVGGLMWLSHNVIDLAASTRAYQSFRTRRLSHIHQQGQVT